MVGQLIVDTGIEVLAGEDDALTERGIEAAMGFRGEPDEVGGSEVGEVAVKVVTLQLFVRIAGIEPRVSDEEVAVGTADETRHPRVVGMDVGFVFEVPDVVVLDRVQSSGREGEKDAHAGAIESCATFSGNSAGTEAEFGAIREEDYLRGR